MFSNFIAHLFLYVDHFPIRLLSILIIVILNSQSDYSKIPIPAISESGILSLPLWIVLFPFIKLCNFLLKAGHENSWIKELRLTGLYIYIYT